MICLHLLVTMALAASVAPGPTSPEVALPEPSRRPVLDLGTEPCPDVVGLHKGVPYTPTCDALLVGVPRYTWQVGMVVWADETDGVRRLVQSQLRVEADNANERADYWKAIASQPAPKRVPPGVWVVAGVVLGGAAVVLGAESVHLVATQ